MDDYKGRVILYLYSYTCEFKCEVSLENPTASLIKRPLFNIKLSNSLPKDKCANSGRDGVPFLAKVPRMIGRGPNTYFIRDENPFCCIINQHHPLDLFCYSFRVDIDPSIIQQFNIEVHIAVSHIWMFKKKVLGLILTCWTHLNANL
jgi:hypothetical protein